MHRVACLPLLLLFMGDAATNAAANAATTAVCCPAWRSYWWSAPNLLFQLMYRQSRRDVESGGRRTTGELRFEALSLTLRRGKAAAAAHGDSDLGEVWQVVSSVRLFRDAASSEPPRLFGPGSRYQDNHGMGEWMDMDKCARTSAAAALPPVQCVIFCEGVI
jgi:hypothetical protein